jgi:hypothetical protein
MFNVIDLESGLPITGSGHILTFEDGASAAKYAIQYFEVTGKKAQVRVVVNDSWQVREKLRFESGDYLPVAWNHAQFWLDNIEIHRLHFAHRSKIKDSCLAYTESPEKGSQDRQTRIKAGAYLTKYFADILSESEINHYARLHASIENALDSEIKFASDADLIEEIYKNGPESCMSYSAGDYEGDFHPVRVYGDSDLQLAYVERQSDYHSKPIAARALIWPDRKIYGRVYPTPERYSDDKRTIARAEYNGLIIALEKLGYTSGRFDGAKIQKVENTNRRGGYIMPYLDGTQGVDDIGNYFLITSNGDYSATETTGLVSENSRYTCENCEESCDEENTSIVNITGNRSTQSWCESCVTNHTFHCYGYDEIFSEYVDSIVADDGYNYSSRYAERNLEFCARTESYIVNESVDQVITSNGSEQWCESAISDHAFFCNKNDSYYSNDDYESVEIDGMRYEKQSAISAGLLVEESESVTV